MLVFLSHSTTTEYTRQLARKRAREWNVECHIYEGGLLNADFLQSLDKTKRERGNERSLNTAATPGNNEDENDDENDEVVVDDDDDDDNDDNDGIGDKKATVTSLLAAAAEEKRNENDD